MTTSTIVRVPPDYLDQDARVDQQGAVDHAAFALLAGADTVHVRVRDLAQATLIRDDLMGRGLGVDGLVCTWPKVAD